MSLSPPQAEDIFVRFFLNCSPAKLSTSFDFSIVLMESYYYYLAVYRGQKAKVVSHEVAAYATSLFRLIPPLQAYARQAPDLVQEHDIGARKVPVYGCVCFDPTYTHVLVIYHVNNSHIFSFPRGKARQGESPLETAARETLEESGLDVSEYISEGDGFHYSRSGKSGVTLFPVENVPMRTGMHSLAPLEISRVVWVPIKDLSKKDKQFGVPDKGTKAVLKTVASFAATKRAEKSISH
jgi:8-oxo-dGTP pyrophosphatase MutT (NUDIX family)